MSEEMTRMMSSLPFLLAILTGVLGVALFICSIRLAFPPRPVAHRRTQYWRHDGI